MEKIKSIIVPWPVPPMSFHMIASKTHHDLDFDVELALKFSKFMHETYPNFQDHSVGIALAHIAHTHKNEI